MTCRVLPPEHRDTRNRDREEFTMSGLKCLPVAAILVILGLGAGAAAADNPRVLLGVWHGKATGPKGGPPTGDIMVTFEKAGAVIGGRIAVKGAGGGEYSGKISGVQLKNRVFSALAVFKFGENPLEVHVTGPLKGKSIEGTFSVVSKGQKMGDGTFSIIKGPPPKPAPRTQ